MPFASDKVTAFRRLHETGCFVIPNPWDAGSARLLAGLGIPALATTSSGFAWTLGRPDNHITLDEALAHFRMVSAAVNVLVGGDFTTVAQLADSGVRRISVDGALARAAWTGLLQAATEIARDGTFTSLTRAVPFTEFNRRFRASSTTRRGTS